MTTIIDRCRSCHGSDLVEVLSLGHQYPVCFPEHKDEIVELSPLDLLLCQNKACGLVQLRVALDPSRLFREHYWYRSGINESMVAALKDIVEAATRRVPVGPQDWVVDIGANDGTLLRQYAVDNPRPPMRCGFEPAENLATRLVAVADLSVHDFFPPLRGLAATLPAGMLGRVKIITAIAMAYDLPDPRGFFSAVADLLDRDGIFIVQLGYLGDMIRYNSFDQICHEHVEYYSLTALNFLLAQAGMVIEEVEWNTVNGGSLRCYCRKATSGAAPGARVLQLIHEEEVSGLLTEEPYRRLAGRMQAMRAQVRDILEAEGGTAVVYGASTKGLTQMQYFGIDFSLAGYAVERDHEKLGRYYGRTGLEIVSEAEWRADYDGERVRTLAMCPIWHFRDGVVARERDWLASGGRFLFPLPRVEVVRG